VDFAADYRLKDRIGKNMRGRRSDRFVLKFRNLLARNNRV